MLERILTVLDEGLVQSKSDLARRVGASEEAVEQMIAHLVSLGYLRTVDSSCDAACSGCPMAGGCSTQPAGRLWTLTEKGTRAAENGNQV